MILKTKFIGDYRVDLHETNVEFNVQITLSDDLLFTTSGVRSQVKTAAEIYFDLLNEGNISDNFTTPFNLLQLGI